MQHGNFVNMRVEAGTSKSQEAIVAIFFLGALFQRLVKIQPLLAVPLLQRPLL